VPSLGKERSEVKNKQKVGFPRTFVVEGDYHRRRVDNLGPQKAKRKQKKKETEKKPVI
jgi:hypothetical protein